MKNLKNLVDLHFEDYTLPEVIDEIEETYPKRGSMKINPNNTHVHSCWDFTNHNYTKARQFWTHADGFVQKNVGRDYDDVYSDFCHKFPEMVGKVNTREYFKSLFESAHWRYGYNVDENNKIQERPPRYIRPRKKVTYVTPENELIRRYRINKKVLKYRPDWYEHIALYIGKDMADKLESQEYLTPKEYYKMMNNCKVRHIELNDPNNPKTHRRYSRGLGWHKESDIIPLNDAFELESFNTHAFEYPEGHHMFVKYNAEKQDAKRKEFREFKKAVEERRRVMLKNAEERKKEALRREKNENCVLKA